jgi:release factor glutamine methyltransferase
LVEVLKRTESWFRERHIDSPRLEAELLLSHVVDMARLKLYLNFDRPVSEGELAKLRPLVARRGRREPLAWILGEAGFHNVELVVHPGVFCPRPDSETLVNAALEWISATQDWVYVADVCCGTGAIGLALAHEHDKLRVWSLDQSDEALANTRENVAKLGFKDRVAVLSSDLLERVPIDRPVHWVVSNPPYIPSGDIHGLMPEVSLHEPKLALDGGPDGLDIYRRLIPAAAKRASQGVLVEIGIHQSPAVIDLFRKAGMTDITTWKDLSGLTRVVGGKKRL